MGLENIPKYLTLSSLIWKLIRPFVVIVARNTRNTTVDDEMIEAIDIVLGAKAVEMENETKEKGVRNAVS